MPNSKSYYKDLKKEELIILAQKGDIQALEEILRSEQKNIFATFSYLTEKREDVADLTQEALLKVAKNIASLKNPQYFKSWLNQIIMHLFYDELRKRSRKPDIISIDDEDNNEISKSIKNNLPDTKCTPKENCISHELEDYIKTQIYNLPKQFRIAIVLRELQGLSYEEIAASTNSSVGTVKSRISRARFKLQESLKNYI